MNKITFVSNIIFRLVFLFLMSQAILGCKNNLTNITIIQKPIVFDDKRIALTKQYRFEHYGIKSSSIEIQPRLIVLHWTNTNNLANSFKKFYPATLYDRPDIKRQGNLNVSAHFLVDRDGTIYQLMPSNWMARHVIGLNNIAIGIENVGGINNREDLTMQQVNADVSLIRFLQLEYPSITYLIGHYEYGEFRGTALWEEKDNSYFTYKTDPGKKFMALVRERLNVSL